MAAARQIVAPEVLTVRGLIVVDAAGRSRMSIGEMPGARRVASFGLAIRDTAGDERFGVALAADGLMGMGFDAPRGTGGEANRERINIGSGPDGLASIRFLDRQTIPRAYLMLTESNRVSLLLNADTASRRPYRLYSALHDTVQGFAWAFERRYAYALDVVVAGSSATAAEASVLVSSTPTCSTPA